MIDLEFLGCVFSNNVREAKILIERKKIDINVTNESGQTVLHIATSLNSSNKEIVSFLIEAGSNLDVQDDSGSTALINTIRYTNEENFRLLINGGADKELKDFQGQTALFYACEKEHVFMIEHLIKLGANVNSIDRFGNTVLCNLALGSNNIDIVELLINAGADINYGKSNYGSPLMCAIQRDNEIMVSFLISKSKIDFSKKRPDGMTILELAKKKGNKRIIKLLNKKLA